MGKPEGLDNITGFPEAPEMKLPNGPVEGFCEKYHAKKAAEMAAKSQEGGPGGPGGMPGGPGGPGGMPMEMPPLPTEMPDAFKAVITATLEGQQGTLVTKDENIYGGSVSGNRIEKAYVQSTKDNESVLYEGSGGTVYVEGCMLDKVDGAYVKPQGLKGPSMSNGTNSVVLVSGEGSKAVLKNTCMFANCEAGDDKLYDAHGVFTVFKGDADLETCIVRADASFGHGVYNTSFGTIHVKDTYLTTSGNNGSVVATDNPGADIDGSESVAVSYGPASAGIYCDGGSNVVFERSYFEAVNDEGAIICNDGHIKLTDCVVVGKNAARIRFRVDNKALFEAKDTTFVATEGSAFIIDGGYCDIVLDHCNLIVPNGHCLAACIKGESRPDDIGDCTLTIKNSVIVGDMGVARGCNFKVILDNTIAVGKFDGLDLELRNGSRITYTSDAGIGSLTGDALPEAVRGPGRVATSMGGWCTVSYDAATSDDSVKDGYKGFGAINLNPRRGGPGGH